MQRHQVGREVGLQSVRPSWQEFVGPTHMEHEQIIFGESPMRVVDLLRYPPRIHDEILHRRPVGMPPTSRTRAEVVDPQEGRVRRVRNSFDDGEEPGS